MTWIGKKEEFTNPLPTAMFPFLLPLLFENFAQVPACFSATWVRNPTEIVQKNLLRWKTLLWMVLVGWSSLAGAWSQGESSINASLKRHSSHALLSTAAPCHIAADELEVWVFVNKVDCLTNNCGWATGWQGPSNSCVPEKHQNLCPIMPEENNACCLGLSHWSGCNIWLWELTLPSSMVNSPWGFWTVKEMVSALAFLVRQFHCLVQVWEAWSWIGC